jgi:hypothetical protein
VNQEDHVDACLALNSYRNLFHFKFGYSCAFHSVSRALPRDDAVGHVDKLSGTLGGYVYFP